MLQRTVVVKLDVSDEQAEKIDETIDEFLQAANHVVAIASSGERTETDKTTLHEQTYEDVRSETRLHSNHVQSARNQAVSALRSTLAKWRRGEGASLPTFTARFVEYNRKNATFNEGSVSLSTVEGRIELDYILPEDNDTPQTKYLNADEWEPASATLHERNGEFFLHICVKTDVDEPEPVENGTVLGVDLGIENIAVTSTGEFWSGNELNHWRREYEERRGSLHECGSRDAYENIQAVGRKEQGRFKQTLHRIANGILREAEGNGCTVIAFEELTGIRIRERVPNASKFHEWAFRRLYEYVSYKAERRGIRVEKVNSAYTSQRCSSCGFTNEANRPSQDTFRCRSCGYENHADYNAAKNIGFRLLRNQTGGGGGAPVGVRLNTGMLTANGVKAVPETVRA